MSTNIPLSEEEVTHYEAKFDAFVCGRTKELGDPDEPLMTVFDAGRALEGNRRWLVAQRWLVENAAHPMDCVRDQVDARDPSYCSCGLKALLSHSSTEGRP